MNILFKRIKKGKYDYYIFIPTENFAFRIKKGKKHRTVYLTNGTWQYPHNLCSTDVRQTLLDCLETNIDTSPIINATAAEKLLILLSKG